MNKVKFYSILAIAVVITAPVCWIIYINQEFLLTTTHAFSIHFLFPEWGVKTAEHCLGFYLGLVFVIGFILGFVLAVPSIFFSKNNARKGKKEITKLKSELTAAKNKPAPDFSLPAKDDAKPDDAQNAEVQDKAETAG